MRRLMCRLDKPLLHLYSEPYSELWKTILTTMTDRLYYPDSFLYKFDAEVREVQETPRPAVVLDRTAFYPTSGGQIHDTGYLGLGDSAMDSARFRVTEVADREDGHIVHYLEAPLKDIEPGTRIRGEIDIARRRDHMQQHSAQHVLSAAFLRLFDIATVSFHMAEDYCSIDLDTPRLTQKQVEAAERVANEIVLENRPVDIRYTPREKALQLGLRKPPAEGHEQLRLIDIRDWDLSACGGTHVEQTGQIAGLLLRKFEKVRQGWRVEFVAGQRAVSTARRDFAALTEAGTLFSAQIYDVPQQARKALEEIRSLRKQLDQAHDDLAAAEAAGWLAETPETQGRRLIVRTFSGRDLSFLKLLAQKITRQSLPAIALLGADSPQPALVFAQSAGQPHDMAALLKQTVMGLGGRGGGSKDLAQGGIPRAGDLAVALATAAQ
jgi:alanyl-tRNA synthetase